MTEMEIEFAEKYKEFLSCAKTERRTVSLLKRWFEQIGFKEYKDGESLNVGDRVYFDCQGKSLAVVVVGAQPLSSGLNIVASHVDSPHLDLKPNPCMQLSGLTYFDTHHYGYIKKYQWLTMPLSLFGVVIKKDGRAVEIMLGEEKDDPRFMITDCSPHFGGDKESCRIGDLVSAEDMDVFASMGNVEELECYLKNKYDIDKSDFASSELEIVPAGHPVFLGFDKKLIAGYGQDDKACVFASAYAIEHSLLSDSMPAKSVMVIFSDKEEVGAIGSTGLDGALLENVLLDMSIGMKEANNDSYLTVRNALRNSRAISADVCMGSDPHFISCDSTGNEARVGGGVVVLKYEGGVTKGGVSDARAEFVATIREIFDRNKIRWQMSENGKQEKGSSGTQANSLAKFGMDVIDVGIPVLNMHSPWEVASISDCYEAYKAYSAFISLGDGRSS